MTFKKQLLIAAVMLAMQAGCNVRQNGADTTATDYHEPLAGFLSTRSSDPLEGTVWMAASQDEFRRMLLFQDGAVRLFYGLIDGMEMQRWSDYYSAPYSLSDDATFVTTELVYPIFGEKELTERVTVVAADEGYCLVTELDTYEFVGGYSHDLDERWTLVFTTIQPWEGGN